MPLTAAGPILDQAVRGAGDEDAVGALAQAVRGIEDCRQRVADAHPDQHGQPFGASACELVVTRENLALHEQVLAEHVRAAAG